MAKKNLLERMGLVSVTDNGKQTEQTPQTPENPVSVQTPQVIQSFGTSQLGSGAMPTTLEQAATPQPVIDPAIVEKIWDAIIAENRPGPDYLELKNNVEALEDAPMSPEQKLISAFKILQKNYPNFAVADITSAIDHYIGVVNREKELGLTELNNIRATTVDAVQDEITNKETEMAEITERYKTLQQEVADLKAQRTAAETDVNTKENTFQASINAVLDVLNNDRKKVESTVL